MRDWHNTRKYHGYYNVIFSQKELITDYLLPSTKVTYVHHGIAIYIDESASALKFPDPNHGELLFKTVTDMNAAIIKLINYGKSPDSTYKLEYRYQSLQRKQE